MRDRDEWVLVIGHLLKQKQIKPTSASNLTQSMAYLDIEEFRLPPVGSLSHAFSVCDAPSSAQGPGGISTRMDKVCEGFLEKRGGVDAAKPYKSRFFRLFVDTGVRPFGNLTYQKDSRTWEVLGSIDIIPGKTIVAADASCKSQRTFLVKNPERTYVLRAAGKKDLEWWMTKLCETLVITGTPSFVANTNANAINLVHRTSSNFYDTTEEKKRFHRRQQPTLAMSELDYKTEGEMSPRTLYERESVSLNPMQQMVGLPMTQLSLRSDGELRDLTG